MAIDQIALLAAVACEIFLMAFMFFIARFYELKFKESTYHVSFLMPALVFVAMLIIALFASIGLEWLPLLTSSSTLLVLMTTGLYLYRKMMGVSR
jgi:small-conductance mechanosensitive channel